MNILIRQLLTRSVDSVSESVARLMEVVAIVILLVICIVQFSYIGALRDQVQSAHRDILVTQRQIATNHLTGLNNQRMLQEIEARLRIIASRSAAPLPLP